MTAKSNDLPPGAPKLPEGLQYWIKSFSDGVLSVDIFRYEKVMALFLARHWLLDNPVEVYPESNELIPAGPHQNSTWSSLTGEQAVAQACWFAHQRFLKKPRYTRSSGSRWSEIKKWEGHRA